MCQSLPSVIARSRAHARTHVSNLILSVTVGLSLPWPGRYYVNLNIKEDLIIGGDPQIKGACLPTPGHPQSPPGPQKKSFYRDRRPEKQ
jgi:hypothetical protein